MIKEREINWTLVDIIYKEHPQAYIAHTNNQALYVNEEKIIDKPISGLKIEGEENNYRIYVEYAKD